MVRAIVGTMLDIGFGQTTLEEFKNIMEQKDRRNAGASAPACGLYLTKVVYPTGIFIEK
jgi:tRNA pseudouridine38-40 synthase